jgi:hypothetical protein
MVEHGIFLQLLVIICLGLKLGWLGGLEYLNVTFGFGERDLNKTILFGIGWCPTGKIEGLIFVFVDDGRDWMGLNIF